MAHGFNKTFPASGVLTRDGPCRRCRIVVLPKSMPVAPCWSCLTEVPPRVLLLWFCSASLICPHLSLPSQQPATNHTFRTSPSPPHPSHKIQYIVNNADSLRSIVFVIVTTADSCNKHYNIRISATSLSGVSMLVMAEMKYELMFCFPLSR